MDLTEEMSIVNTKKEWFGEWFNSPFYHILYKNRDHQEAQEFIDGLANHLHFQPQDHILDLACGKGRHSIYLSRKGLRVTGMDLSPENIAIASKFSNDLLDFKVQDMRESFGEKVYSCVLNLFTSFGYFDTKEENQLAIDHISRSLLPEGTFLIDFLNPTKTIAQLIPHEVKQIGSIEFKIDKHLSADGFIIKNISFVYEGEQHHYQEKVKAIDLQEFLAYFENAGLELKATYGNYQFQPFDPELSDRMILLAMKKL
jgi:SAM-dependent methyltransferase